ncbi:prepilin-type cleavage/methylation domain-containing protein [Fischerella thermalis CCMEE 5319]|nr:prepilin-type cleavage/methylation domain-containing protein [Fischerella thermalis CCMEE 5319]
MIKKSCLCKYQQQNTGYTLIEILAIVLIVGILSAIAAPSWLAFVSRQRVNKANDAILVALQEAQREAKKNKRNYSVSFTTDSTTQVAKIAVYPTSATGAPNNYWRVLGEDLGLKQKEVVLGTNITNQNTAGTSITYASAFNASAPQTITFDYMGTLPGANFGTIPTGATEPPGFRIVVAIPQPGNPTQPSNTRRCVIVQTLIGEMRTNKDSDCDI